MGIQIFGTKKCKDTRKAERFFKERGIKYQFVDMKDKGSQSSGGAHGLRPTGTEWRLSKGEFNSVAQANGGAMSMLDPAAKDQDALKLIEYIAEEDKADKILENQHLIKTPIVRNGKQSAVCYQPDIWKGWCS